MITRAFVENVGTAASDYEAKLQLRIPLIDGLLGTVGATSDANLKWASILAIPGLDVQYRPGDVVIVAFENNDLDSPLVLGHLKTTGNLVNQGARVAGSVQQLIVEDTFVAPTDTTIGKTEYAAIFSTINEGTSGDPAKLNGISFNPQTGELVIESEATVTVKEVVSPPGP